MYPIILIGGFGRSGTQALHEILRAHKDIYALPKYEFRLLTDPDGLLSLESALVNNWTNWQVDFAIDRFKILYDNLGSKWEGPYVSANYRNHFKHSYGEAFKFLLKELQVLSYKGVWAGRSSLFGKVCLKVLNHKPYSFITNNISYCPPIDGEKFRKISSKFIQILHDARMKIENKSIIVLNEPFVSQNPQRSLDISGAKKIIVVYRDPRDIFKSYQYADWSPNKIEIAAKLLMDVYNRWRNEKKHLSKNSFLEIKFEELITNTDITIKRISDFINIEIDYKTVKNSDFSIKKAHVGEWKAQFSENEKVEINNAFEKLLIMYDYK